MSIESDIETALSAVTDNYFHGMPEFGESEEPSDYVVYTITGRPTNFSSGESNSNVYFVALAIISVSNIEGLCAEIETAMKDNGFGLQRFGDTGILSEFPRRKQYYMDFYKNYDT